METAPTRTPDVTATTMTEAIAETVETVETVETEVIEAIEVIEATTTDADTETLTQTTWSLRRQ